MTTKTQTETEITGNYDAEEAEYILQCEANYDDDYPEQTFGSFVTESDQYAIDEESNY